MLVCLFYKFLIKEICSLHLFCIFWQAEAIVGLVGGWFAAVWTFWEAVSIFVLPVDWFALMSAAIAASTAVTTATDAGATGGDCCCHHCCCNERGHFFFHFRHGSVTLVLGTAVGRGPGVTSPSVCDCERVFFFCHVLRNDVLQCRDIPVIVISCDFTGWLRVCCCYAFIGAVACLFTCVLCMFFFGSKMPLLWQVCGPPSWSRPCS